MGEKRIAHDTKRKHETRYTSTYLLCGTERGVLHARGPGMYAGTERTYL